MAEKRVRSMEEPEVAIANLGGDREIACDQLGDRDVVAQEPGMGQAHSWKTAARFIRNEPTTRPKLN